MSPDATDTNLDHRARRVLAQSANRMLAQIDEPTRRVPRFFSHGSGAWLYDDTGSGYLDLNMARGAVVLGYGSPVIAKAIQKHASNGILTSLRHPAEVDVAEFITRSIPCAETVAFGKNGSDACTAAVRIARALTGRTVILSCGYHGFHDWFAATMPGMEGFPSDLARHVVSFDLNDGDGLERLVGEHRSNLAGIIIEPAHRAVGTPAFLKLARRLADDSGSLLIFDEVVTAFRVGLGGCQGVTGVLPDLACLGKAMANGYPLSAVAGRRDIMRGLGRTFFSMTYQTDSLGFVLARACLTDLRERNVPQRLATIGDALRTAFDSAADLAGIPARACGPAARLDLCFPPADGLDTHQQEQIFLNALLEAGILPSLSVFPCDGLTTADVALASQAFSVAMERISARKRNG